MRPNTCTLVLSLLQLCWAISPSRRPHQPLGNGSQILSYNETVTHPSFTPKVLSVSWLPGQEDGQIIYMSDEGALVQENFVTGDTTTFVAADRIPDDYHEYWIRPDQQKVLFSTNYTKQYRYSYFANYFVLDTASGQLTPLSEDQVGDIQYAEFAPTGDIIAYVRGNNLFIYDGKDTTQVTTDGGPDMFNAVPDWVYEEEVYGGRSTLWFSPDAQYIGYLSLNETGVPTYTVAYYMDNQKYAPTDPRELHLRYPKVGATNPTVQFHLLDLISLNVTTPEFDAFEQNNTIIGEVFWTTANHSSVVYRAFNRVQDLDRHVRVDTSGMTATVIQERDGRDGWIDNSLNAKYVGSVNDSDTTYYVDTSDISGWNHLYLFPVNGGKSIALTSGEWEITSIDKVDTARQLIYYTSTERHSTERHLYAVSYSTFEKKALVDDTEAAYYSASYSSAAGYFLLNYIGPDVPYQELYSTADPTTPIRTVTDNAALFDKLQSYSLPNITYFELPLPDSNWTINVMQRLPPNFDPAKKYPIIFTPYGGPGSQMVNKRFQSLGWASFISSDPDFEYISYTVDNRGTGFKGRAFRTCVTSHLGTYEAADQLYAARHLTATTPYIDSSHVAMWGWSFGGFLTSKVLESNDPPVFTLGLITAPVTDWRLYDSVYTERYMKLPNTNAAGYDATAVRNTTNFHSVAGGFAILHGTGDDNVHYQNTAGLVDLLLGDGVGPDTMQWLAFTDSDHTITYNRDSAFLYKYLTMRVYEERNRGNTPKMTTQWKRKRSSEEFEGVLLEVF